MKDYYKTLGVDRNASNTAIKKAYKKLAVTYHPDKNPSVLAHDKFAEINEAYQVLSDPSSRSNYDFLSQLDVSVINQSVPEQEVPKRPPPPPVFVKKEAYKPGKFVYVIVGGFVGLAVGIWLIAVFLQNNASRYNYEIANEAYLNENYGEAYYYLEISLGQNSENVKALFLKGLLDEISEKDKLKALESYNAAIFYAGEEVPQAYYLARGNILVQLERYDAAFADYENVLLSDPNNLDAYLNQANILLYQKNEYDEAIWRYDKVLEMLPEDFDASLGKGVSLLQKEEFAEASNYLTLAKGKKPENPVVTYFIGKVFLDVEKDTLQACEFFHEADSLGGLPGIKNEINKYCR